MKTILSCAATLLSAVMPMGAVVGLEQNSIPYGSIFQVTYEQDGETLTDAWTAATWEDAGADNELPSAVVHPYWSPGEAENEDFWYVAIPLPLEAVPRLSGWVDPPTQNFVHSELRPEPFSNSSLTYNGSYFKIVPFKRHGELVTAETRQTAFLYATYGGDASYAYKLCTWRAEGPTVEIVGPPTVYLYTRSNIKIPSPPPSGKYFAWLYNMGRWLTENIFDFQSIFDTSAGGTPILFLFTAGFAVFMGWVLIKFFIPF